MWKSYEYIFCDFCKIFRITWIIIFKSLSLQDTYWYFYRRNYISICIKILIYLHKEVGIDIKQTGQITGQ